MLTSSQEDYLRIIYNLYEENGQSISSVNIAEYLNISKAAVSKMLKKMSFENLIEMNPYSNIFFTKKGLREAKKVVYKHRIIEVFLIKILKVDKNKMHDEAHKLEHAFSDKSIKKLANFLNNPKFCPDGKKIPKII